MSHARVVQQKSLSNAMVNLLSKTLGFQGYCFSLEMC